MLAFANAVLPSTQVLRRVKEVVAGKSVEAVLKEEGN